MKTVLDWLANQATGRPWTVVVVIAVVTALLGAGLPRYGVEAANDDFLAPADVAAQTLLADPFEFPGSASPFVVLLEPHGGNAFSRESVVATESLMQALRADPDVATWFSATSRQSPSRCRPAGCSRA